MTKRSGLTSRLPRIKAWLRQNKILFETVTATLLAVMAVTVGIAQYVTASRQTSLTELQARIAEAQALPRFEIAARQILGDSGIFEEDRLVVENNGGPVREFSAQSLIVMEVDVGFGVPIRSRKLEIAFNDYYTAQGVSAAGTGVLTTFRGPKDNHRRFVTMTRDLHEAARTRKWDYANASLTKTVMLSYRDLLGRAHTDYYRAAHVGPGYRLEDAAGKAVFDRFPLSGRKSLERLTAEQVLDLAAQM
jgi:hypothetical protein